MTILLAGTPQTTVTVAEALTSAAHSVVGVLCPFPKPVGRKHVITPCALEIWANKQNIPVFHVDKVALSDEELRQKLPAADLLVVADFGYLVPSWLLRHAKHGALNLHPSLLPRWRGATPVPFTLLFGDRETGITIISMNEKFDMGGIVAQETIEIQDTDTTPELLDRAFRQGSKLLISIISDFTSGKIKATPQDATVSNPQTRKFTKEDGFLPFEVLKDLAEGKAPSLEISLLTSYTIPTTLQTIDRMIRAITPWPAAWTTLPDGKRAKLLKSHLENNTELILDEVRIEGQPPSRNIPLTTFVL